jgi:hypothetical protein
MVLGWSRLIVTAMVAVSVPCPVWPVEAAFATVPMVVTRRGA